MSSHEELFGARERLDRPHDGRLLRHVLTIAGRCFKLGTVHIGRHWYDDLDVVRRAPLLELTLRFHHVFDARVRVALDDRLDPEQRLHLRVQAIRHELEVAIGRYERDRAIVLETRQTHALMKLHVL